MLWLNILPHVFSGSRSGKLANVVLFKARSPWKNSSPFAEFADEEETSMTENISPF